jgi:hypothetical protein
MGETKLFKPGSPKNNSMGDLQLAELVNELARQLNVTLSDKPRENVSDSVQYWKTGSNGQYTIDHTVVHNHGSYLVIIEETGITAKTEAGCKKEKTETGIAAFLDKQELYVHFHGHTALIDQYKERMKKLSPNIKLQRFYNMLELEIERQDCEKTAGIASECFDVETNFDKAEDLKALPQFVKEFYG